MILILNRESEYIPLYLLFAGNELVQVADEDILDLPLFRLSQLVQTGRRRPKFPAFLTHAFTDL